MEQDVILCSYNTVTGWRISAVSKSRYDRLAIVKIGNLKLLRLPVHCQQIPGRFCNPRKVLGI